MDLSSWFKADKRGLLQAAQAAIKLSPRALLSISR